MSKSINVKRFHPNAVFLLLLLTVFVSSCNGQDRKAISKESAVVEKEKHQTDGLEIGERQKSQNYGTSLLDARPNLDAHVSQFLRDTYQEEDGTIWYATNVSGLVRYKNGILEKLGPDRGFVASGLRTIVPDKNGVLWFGTSSGLIKYEASKEDAGENPFTTYTSKDGLLYDDIWSLAIDRSGILWIGTGSGLNRFDGTKITTVDLPRATIENPKPTLSPNRIGSILEDKLGTIWIAVDGYGITKYNPSLPVDDKNAYSFLTKKEGLNDNNIGSLFEDSKGNIWIGSMFGGLSKYDPSAESKENSYTNYTKMGLVKGIEVGGLLEDAKGNIWFNVEHFGVYRFDPKAEQEGRNAFTNFTTKDGLATNGILSIFEDNNGSLWFSTWEGVTGYDGVSFFSVTERGPW